MIPISYIEDKDDRCAKSEPHLLPKVSHGGTVMKLRLGIDRTRMKQFSNNRGDSSV